jgi:hypothetical protein
LNAGARLGQRHRWPLDQPRTAPGNLASDLLPASLLHHHWGGGGGVHIVRTANRCARPPGWACSGALAWPSRLMHTTHRLLGTRHLAACACPAGTSAPWGMRTRAPSRRSCRAGTSTAAQVSALAQQVAPLLPSPNPHRLPQRPPRRSSLHHDASFIPHPPVQACPWSRSTCTPTSCPPTAHSAWSSRG